MVHFLAEKRYTPTPKMLLLALCLGALVLHHSDAQGGQGSPQDPCLGNYTFEGTDWTVLWNVTEGNITFTMSGPFPGWFSIGFSDFPFDVSLHDLIVAGDQDLFFDGYISSMGGGPLVDASQDATLIAFTVDQITAESTATFSRPLITGDVDDDDALDVPLYLQYAYGNITNASLNQIGDPGDNRWISRHRLSFDCSVSSPPRNVTFVNGTNTSVTLSWLPPLTPNGVVQFYRVTIPFESAVVQDTTGNETTLTVNGLIPGLTYEAQVEAFTTTFGIPSPGVSVTTRPSAPVQLITEPRENASMLLSWMEDSVYYYSYYADYGMAFYMYELQYAGIQSPNPVSSDFFEPQTVSLGNVVMFNLTDLVPGSTYEFSVRAANEAGPSGFVTVINTTLEEAPSPPRNLTALSITNTRYNMSWLPPLTPNGVVQLYRVSISRATTDAQNTSDTSVILDLDEAPSGTAFFVTVQAFTVAFGAASSEVTIIIPPPFLTAITSSSSVFLTWDNDPEPLFPYEISLTGVSTPNPVTAAFFATQTFVRQGTSVQVDGLLSGTTYQFSVRALGEAGPSPSVSVINTTLEGLPSAPENLNVTNVLANQFTLEWDPPFVPNGIIQFYAVFVQGLDTLNQVSASFFQVQQFLTLDLSVNISAMPYSIYAVDIGAVTNAGLGNLSSASVLTPEAPPSPVRDLTAVILSSTGAQVSWNYPLSPNGPVGFYVLDITGISLDGSRPPFFQSVSIVFPDPVCVGWDRDLPNCSLPLTGLTPYTSYNFSVTTVTFVDGLFGQPATVFNTTFEDMASAPNVTSVISFDNSILVSWLPPVFPNGQVLRYNLTITANTSENGQMQNVLLPASSLNFTFSGLDTVTSYTIQIQAVNGFGGGEVALVAAQTGLSPPSEPLNLTATAISSSAVTLSWDPPSMLGDTVQQYRAVVGILVDGNFPPGENEEPDRKKRAFPDGPQLIQLVNETFTNDTSHTFVGLVPFTTYTFTVFAENEVGLGPGVSVMETTLEDVPSAPRNLTQTVDSSTESSIYLQWERPLSPNGVINRYQIAYRGLQTPNAVYIGNFTSTSLQLVDPPVTFFNLSGGLIPGSSYEIAVQAATSAGLGPSSNRIVAVTAESAPSAPLFLTYTPGGVLNDSISLRWLPPQHPNGVVRFYQVQLVFTRVGEPLLANTADNTTTLVLSGLTPGTQYNFSVRAFTVAFGPFSNQLTLHTADVPLVPQDVRAISNGTTSLVVTWKAPAVVLPHDNSLTTYEVQYRGVDSPNLLNTTFFVAVTVPVGMTLSHTISGLMAYSAYNVSVRATNQYGVGDFSEEVTVRTEEGEASAPIPTFISPSGTTITVFWLPPDFPNGILLSYNLTIALNTLNDTGMQAFTVPAVDRFFTFTDLEHSTEYLIQIQAVNGFGGGEMLQLVVQTGLIPPSVPLSLTATAISSSAVTLSWDPPSMLSDTVELYFAVVGLDLQNLYSLSYPSYNDPQNQYQEVPDSNGQNEGVPDYGFSVPFQFVQFLQNNEEIVSDTPPFPCGFFAVPFNDTGIPLNDTSEGTGNFSQSPGEPVIPVRSFPGAPPGLFIVNLMVTNETSHTFMGLCPFTTYNFSVSAVNMLGGGPYADVSATTLEDVPSAPLNLMQLERNSTESSIYLQWETPLSPNGVIIEYQIIYRGLQTPNAVVANFSFPSMQRIGPVTSFNLSEGLIPGSSYEIAVQAATSAGLGPSSNTIVAVTAESAPSAPLNLTFPPGGVLINSIALTWLQPQYPNGIVRFYQVQLVFNGVGEPLLVNTTDNTTTAVLSDLTPGTQYNVSVRAFTVALGPFSDQLTLHTADVPSVPQGVTANANSSTSVLVAWMEPAVSFPHNNSQTTYEVRYRGVDSPNDVDESFFNVVIVSAGMRLSRTISGLMAYSAYNVSVRATNQYGVGDFSEEVTVRTEEGVPSVPLNVTLRGSTPTSLEISWSTPSFSNGANLTYRVEYTGVATENAVNDSFSTPNFLESSTTSVTISGLVPFSTYTIGVSASTSAGAGPMASINATTTAAAPSQPQALRVTFINATTVSVVWEPPLSPNGIILNYTIDIALHVPESLPFITSISADTSETLGGLEPATTYTVSVRGMTSAGIGDAATVIVTTLPLTPDGSVLVMPQNVSVSDGQSVTFMCVVDLVGSYVVQWSHNGEVLPGENQSLLTVSDVTAAQGGTYTCLVVNEVGSGMDEGRLYVSAFFLEHPVSTVIFVGENATLSCSAVGFPAPNISWVKDGGVVEESVGIETTTSSNDTQTQSVLTITSASVNLTGVYHCLSITDIEGFPPELVQSNSANITVQGPPDTPVVTTLQANTTSIFLSWEEPADNNAPILMYQITLQVVGDGSGNTSVFTSATTELTVTGLTPFTVYSVQVVAVNSIGSSPPSPLRTVMTAEGTPSQPEALEVTFINATIVSVVWEPPLSPNGIILNYTIDIALHVPESLPFITSISADTNETLGGLEPATTYTVSVRGMTSAGIGDAATVIVTTLPLTPDGSVLVMPQNVSVSDGQSVTFMCVVDLAGSYVVQWSHNGEVLPGENQSLLTVSDVTAAQGGTYTCLVVNEVGSGMDEGRLYVSAFFLEHPVSTVIFVGENATLSCSVVGFPAPNISWVKDGGVVEESVGIETTTSSNDTQTQSVLTITSASVNLTGVYHCLSITDIEGFPPELVQSNSANITVQGPPDTPVVTTLQANTTSIFLLWEEPADNNASILMYQITLQVVGDGSGNTSVFTSATTELTVTGLTPFTVYSVQVVAVNSIGSSPPSPLRTVMTAEGTPSQPEALEVTFINATTVSVVWEPPLSPNGIILNYTIDIALHVPESLPFITSISADTSETLGGLEPATTYTVTVRGMTSAGIGDAATVIVTTLPLTPDGSVLVMPQNVSVSDGQSVTFMCVVDLVGSYMVQWSHNGEVLPGENQSLLTVSDVTAAQGGTYTCLVVNEVGSGMDEGRLYVNALFLEHPVSTVIFVGENATLSCSAVGFPTPNISWIRDGGVVEESVGIETTTSSNGTQTQSVLTITNASVTLTGVYHCRSTTTIEGFPPELVQSNPANITVQGPPDTPVVTTLQANTTSIFLSWEEPADNNAPILMYQITLQVVGNGSGNTSVFTSATTELTVTGLTPFTVYSVQVVAVNSIGSSSPSPIRTVMTAGGTPSTPVDVRALENLSEPRRLAITWAPPLNTNGDIESYDVQYRRIGSPVDAALSGFFQIQTLSVNATMALLQDLIPFSVYNISVRANTGAGPGPFSEEISVATLEDVPSAPLELRVTDQDSFGFNLEWGPPSSPNGIIDFYQVELFTENSLDLPALNAINVSSTSYNFTDLAPFTGYSVQVCAYTVGCGDVATLNVTTLGVPPVLVPSDGVSNIPITMGDPVTISFTIVNEPVPNVTREGIQWVFTGIGGAVNLSCTSTSKYSFSDNCLSLTVSNTEGSDAGQYQIVITTEAGIGISTVGISVSGDKPSLLSHLMDATLPQGSTHMFVCAASAIPFPFFVFRFNGERITFNSSERTVITTDTHATLTLFNLQGTDEGTYNCSVSNRFGSVSTAAVLTVQVSPTLTRFPSGVRDVVKGEALVASCEATADPPPVIQWFTGDTLLGVQNQSLEGVSIVSQSIDDVTTSSQLTVTGFTSNDTGVYSCVAVNALGNDSRLFQVNTVVRPNITGIRSTLNGAVGPELNHEGMLSLPEFTPQLELTCEAYGIPSPEVVWLRNGVALQNLPGRRVITVEDGGPFGELGSLTRSTLILSEVQLSDAGEYTCRATSGNVSPIPGTTAWTFTFNVTELDECDPDPCQNNGMCVDGVRNYTCSCTSIILNEVEIYYTGRNCEIVVDNRVLPSVITSPLSKTVNLNDRITLSCSAAGNPTPSIRWYKDGKPIEGPQAIGDVFVIPEATPNERGFYQCQAFSSFGESPLSAEAITLIQGIVQFRIDILLGGSEGPSTRRKRQSSVNTDIVETLRLQTVNQPLAVEGNYTATVYSVEPAGDTSSDIVITVATDSSESPATLTDQLTGPLEQTLEEVTDINQQISFAITATLRHDGCPKLPDSVCGNVDRVTWPETEIGQEASIPCPCGVSDPLVQQLRGTRRCGGTYDTGAVWEEPRCDSCIFSNTRLTLCQLAEIDSPAQLANVLVNVTNNTMEIQSEDVSLTVGLLDTVTNSTEDLQQSDVQMDVLSIVSNVQQVSPEVLVVSQEQTQSSNRLLETVDQVLNAVEVNPEEAFEFASPEFGVRVEDPPEDLEDGGSFSPSIAPLLNDIMSSTAGNMEMPELPPAMVTLASTLLRPSDSGGRRPRISTSIFGRDSLFQQRRSFIMRTNRTQEGVGSIVLDITLRLDGAVLNVFRPPNSNVVRPGFTKSTRARNEGSETTCRFWNFTADEGFGAWDDSSCRVLEENDTDVECGCDHLTHFAILLDFNPNPPTEPPPIALALTWVSYIGTILSVISLTITIITYLGEKNLRKTVHAKLLINLCFSLVGLYVTFIISTVSTGVPVLCGVVSALMHYFFLAVFFWMAAEAIQLHRKLVSVFKPDIENYVFIAMAICWVVPAFIVVFSLAPFYQNYIHVAYCRVHGYSFWIGLLVPFGIIYIMNWVIFILIFGSLLCRRNARKETNNNEKLRKLKENFMIALGLSLLFGMGWAIGLLASSDLPPAVRYPAEWVFTLATAFLGVYLFVLYILRSPDARNLWKMWLCCQFKKKPGSDFRSTSTPKRTRWGTVSSTLRSWGGNLRPNILRRVSKDTSAINSTLTPNPSSTSPNTYSTTGGMAHINSSYAEPSTVGFTSPPVEIEMVRRPDPDGQSNNENGLNMVSPSAELPVKLDIDTESFVETMSFYDNSSLLGFNAISSQSDQGLSGRDCYIVENRETQGPDGIPL